MKLSPELEARILAMPGTTVNGRPATGVRAPTPAEFISEREFQEWVVALARERGWEVYHTHDSRRSEPGFPDLVLLRETPGARARLVIAELKMPGNKPTSAQRDWLRLFELAGAEVFTWWPGDAPTIAETLH